jgi:hypothetical protein
MSYEKRLMCSTRTGGRAANRARRLASVRAWHASHAYLLRPSSLHFKRAKLYIKY